MKRVLVPAPIAEMMMHVVVCSLSVIDPISTEPTIVDKFASSKVKADRNVEVPNVVRAYDGS